MNSVISKQMCLSDCVTVFYVHVRKSLGGEFCNICMKYKVMLIFEMPIYIYCLNYCEYISLPERNQ